MDQRCILPPECSLPAVISFLAVTIYELLTLRPVYLAEDRQQLLKQIAFEEPTRLRRVDPEIPSELETIILKAMSKDMEERYESARELRMTSGVSSRTVRLWQSRRYCIRELRSGLAEIRP